MGRRLYRLVETWSYRYNYTDPTVWEGPNPCRSLRTRRGQTAHASTIHPYKDAGGRPARCRVQIYLPNDIRDAPVVICSELRNNPGASITSSAEAIAAGVIQANELPSTLMWIEPWPKESTEGGPETFASWSCSLATVSRRERPTSGRRGHG